MSGTDDTPLSLGEAAKLVEVSRSTLQRRLKAGEVPGATRTDNGGWSIPRSALETAGIPLRRTPAPDTGELVAELEQLRTERDALRIENQHLRAVAQERAVTLRVLEEGNEERAYTVRVMTELMERMNLLLAAQPQQISAPGTSDTAPSRRWFHRRK
jgi:predicted transcriptional regulator